MIKDVKTWREWEQAFLQNQKSDFWQNLKIYEALYLQARQWGALPEKNNLEGLDFKIKFAKALNVSGIPEEASPGT